MFSMRAILLRNLHIKIDITVKHGIGFLDTLIEHFKTLGFFYESSKPFQEQIMLTELSN